VAPKTNTNVGHTHGQRERERERERGLGVIFERMTEAKERQKIVWRKEEAEAGGAGAEDAPMAMDRDSEAASAGGAPLGFRAGAGRQRRKSKHVFITGMDLFTTEEIAKREKRAERFSTQGGLSSYKPVEKDEDEIKRQQRAARFGIEYKEPDLSGMTQQDLLEKRKEAEESSSSRLDTIHVYGVDLLSTNDIMKYFSAYMPQYVEWINDSSCNVVFADDSTAKRVLVGLGKPLVDGEADSVDKLYRSMGKTWHKGEDFIKGRHSVPLIFRLAMENDVKPRGEKKTRALWLHPADRSRYQRRNRKRRSGEMDVEMRDAGDLRSKISRTSAPEPDGNRTVVNYGDII